MYGHVVHQEWQRGGRGVAEGWWWGGGGVRYVSNPCTLPKFVEICCLSNYLLAIVEVLVKADM